MPTVKQTRKAPPQAPGTAELHRQIDTLAVLAPQDLAALTQIVGNLVAYAVQQRVDGEWEAFADDLNRGDLDAAATRILK